MRILGGREWKRDGVCERGNEGREAERTNVGLYMRLLIDMMQRQARSDGIGYTDKEYCDT